MRLAGAVRRRLATSLGTEIRRSAGWNNRQDQVRRVGAVVQDSLAGDTDFGVGGRVGACVQVSVEAREVGRRDFEADAMAAPEDVGRDADFDLICLDGARLQEAWLVLSVAVTGTNDAVAEIHRVAGGCDIHELGGPVGVQAIGGGVEH